MLLQLTIELLLKHLEFILPLPLYLILLMVKLHHDLVFSFLRFFTHPDLDQFFLLAEFVPEASFDFTHLHIVFDFKNTF